MKLATVINEYARPYSPYMSGLVNHLPMGQLALYMMGNNLGKIKSYSENYVKTGRIDKVKQDYMEVDTIDECLGKRDLYEGCRDLIRKEILSSGVDELVSKVLNSYPLGMSSGLFHTIIRLAYATEGRDIDEDLTEEVSRALAYYLTAYRAGKKFTNKVSASEFDKQVKMLLEDAHIQEVITSGATRGKTLKALYEDELYMQKGPLIDGSADNKIKTLLHLLLPLFDKTNNIVILHCITGLQALLVLEEYFDDFPEAVDIMTSCIITHLFTVEDIKIESVETTSTDLDWKTITRKASGSPDVHTIKFVYSAYELYNKYGLLALKGSSVQRIKRN